MLFSMSKDRLHDGYGFFVVLLFDGPQHIAVVFVYRDDDLHIPEKLSREIGVNRTKRIEKQGIDGIAGCHGNKQMKFKVKIGYFPNVAARRGFLLPEYFFKFRKLVIGAVFCRKARKLGFHKQPQLQQALKQPGFEPAFLILDERGKQRERSFPAIVVDHRAHAGGLA